MTDFLEYKQIIRRLVSDEDAATITDDLIYDGFLAALRAIAAKRAKHNKTILNGDGSSTYTLPTDLLKIDTLYDNDGLIILPYIDNKAYPHSTDVSTNTWFLYPEGSITFNDELSTSAKITMYYYGDWDTPASMNDDTFVLTVPKTLLYPISLYNSAYCLIPSSVTNADIRQYATRIDSGTPIQNPMKEHILFLMQMYQNELTRLQEDIGISRGF